MFFIAIKAVTVLDCGSDSPKAERSSTRHDPPKPQNPSLQEQSEYNKIQYDDNTYGGTMRYYKTVIIIIAFLFQLNQLFAATPKPAIAKHGMVVSSEPIAAGIGLQVLKDGGNAIDAVPDKGGRISLALGRTSADEASYIAVSDNGPGIAQNMLTQIFTAFFTTKGSKGNGLGLAVARKISKEQGWSLTVSAADPTGASFRIEIPDKKESTTGEQREPQPPAGELS